MNTLRTCAVLAGLALSISGAQIDIFTAKDLQGISQTPVSKGSTYSDRNLARYGNHYLLLVTRKQTGSSEVHQHEADIFVVEAGTATILTGGKIIGPHVTKPGEIRGSGIEGGERHTLARGDVIHIPAGIPHQLLLNQGQPFSYFVVKVTGQ